VAKIDFIFICISFCKIKSNQFPFSRLAVGWQKMALLVLRRVGLCVGQNQMCHLWVGCLFTLTDNVLQLQEVAVLEH
jgi:hypothetical protein